MFKEILVYVKEDVDHFVSLVLGKSKFIQASCKKIIMFANVIHPCMRGSGRGTHGTELECSFTNCIS